MTKYPMIYHEKFITAMEQLMRDYEAGRGTDVCTLCTTAKKYARERSNFCTICPWMCITGRSCISTAFQEPGVSLLCVMGQARAHPIRYPAMTAIRITELHEWIKLYRADLAKQ